MTTTQEPKYKIVNNAIVNRHSGEPIPPDEPVFVLRARDKFAIGTLNYYLSNDMDADHRRAVELRLKQFEDFSDRHPDRMKVPDTILTADWPGYV